MIVDLAPMWDTQRAGFEAFFEAVARGQRRILIQSPTGGGKTRLGAEICKYFLQRDQGASWYTNRRMLLEQTSDVFERFGITAGIRAAGHLPSLHHQFQICSVQTEESRVGKSGTWTRHPAKIAVFDEAHVMTGPTIRKIMEGHYYDGAIILGLSATPIGCGDLYDELITAGTNTQLRECGALVWADHFGPDEPDIRGIGKGGKPTKKRVTADWSPDPDGDDLSENEVRKIMGNVDDGMRPDTKMTHLFGRVFDNWARLNPDQKPTILFAPGIRESVWFAGRFADKGVKAAHIDGDNIAYSNPGSKAIDWLESNAQNRAELLERSRTGEVKVICNRFVLREGIDAPWLQHGILATIFGSVASYLQSGGRLLRAAPGIEKVVIQDHGGNWWRHGGFNADRVWHLSDTNRSITGVRMDGIRDRSDKQPWRCPECSMILVRKTCPCGYEAPPGIRSRPVVTSEGQLIELKGDVLKPRKRSERADTAYQWTSYYCRLYSAKGGTMTFRQAEGLFCYEKYYYPPRTLALMPREPIHWYWRIHEVPTEALNGPVPDWLEGFRAKRDSKLKSQ